MVNNQKYPFKCYSKQMEYLYYLAPNKYFGIIVVTKKKNTRQD